MNITQGPGPCRKSKSKSAYTMGSASLSRKCNTSHNPPTQVWLAQFSLVAQSCPTL